MIPKSMSARKPWFEVVLGSDKVRAAYGMARLYDKEDHDEISNLFRPPGATLELINGEKLMDTPCGVLLI